MEGGKIFQGVPIGKGGDNGCVNQSTSFPSPHPRHKRKKAEFRRYEGGLCKRKIEKGVAIAANRAVTKPGVPVLRKLR